MRNNRESDTALRIHNAALKLLENPGIQLDHDGICEMLLKAGAKAGKSSRTICFPEELVNEKLSLCPKEFVFADRDGKGKTVSANGETVIWSVPGLNMVEKENARRFTSSDMENVPIASTTRKCGWRFWLRNG